MSLIHWWPLNGDLKDYGVLNNNLSSNYLTYDNAGKIGKCGYINNNNIPLNIAAADLPFNTKGISFCGWFKFNKTEIQNVLNTRTFTSSQPYATGNLIGNNDYGGFGLIWATNDIYPSGTFSNLRVGAIQRDSNGTAYAAWRTISDFDTWYHFVASVDPIKGKVSFYVNGSLYLETTKNSFQLSSTSYYINVNYVFGGNGPGLSIPFYFNDIRIYDHALSAKEVKEISKGLVLHYDFNDPYVEGTTNRYAYSGENPYWSLTFYDGATGNYGYNADSNGQCECVTAIDKYGKSKKMIKVSLRTARRTQPYVHFDYLSGYIDNQTYATVSFDMYSTCTTSVGPYSYYSGYYFSYWNDTTKQWVGGSSTSIQIPNLKINQWNHIVFRIYRDTTEYNSGPGFCPVGTSSSTSDYWLFDNIQIEAKDHATPFVNGTRPQKVNLISSITAGGNVTKDSNTAIHTNGSNADTYFYLNFSKDMEYGKNYYLSCNVSGFANANEWWYFPICLQSYADNGIIFKNGKCGAIFEYKSSEATRVILDDSGYSSSSVRTETIYITDICVSEVPDIFDCSGYRNNAITVGNIPVREDSGKGNYCLDLTNDGIFIETNKLNFISLGTIVFWAKYSSANTSDSKMVLSSAYTTSYYIGAADTNNNWYHANSGTITGYRDGVANNTLLRDDKWHCYAFTGINLSNWNYFVSIVNYMSTSLPEKYRFHGKIADIKIYATVLSADDILAEYNKKASIDKSGILFTGEFEEGNSTNINVTKTAMVKGNNFIEGASNVKFLEGYTQLEYIESTGTQYINTGAVLGNNFELILDQENNLGTGNEYLCGSSSAGKMIGLLNNRLWTNGVVYTTVEVGKNVRQVIGTKITTDGSNGSDYRCTNYTMKSFMKGHSSYTPSGTGSTIIFGTGSARSSFKCFNCKIFNNEMLVRDLIPVKRKSDNVLGLYDLVNKQFYTNAGSGTFIAGPEISNISAVYANEIKEI